MNYMNDDEKLTTNEKAWWGLILLMLIFLVMLLVVAFNMVMTDLGARYVINGYSTNEYKKDGDCVKFIDTRGRDYKLCGAYTIRERFLDK